MSVADALKGGRPGTSSRPMSVAGRYVRLGTMSMVMSRQNAADGSGGGEAPLVDVERLDCSKYGKKPAIGKV